MYQYSHPHPAVTVDCVVFGLDGGELKVLLIRRGLEPQRGCWALPGGFIRMDETLDESARRELREESGVDDLYLEQLYTFGDPGRDPRERVVTVAYYAIVNLFEHPVKAGTDARVAAWFPLGQLPELAFDHRRILEEAHRRLRGKVRYQPVGFEFLPRKFTLTQLQRLYETILGKALDKRNFRKKILASGLLVALEEVESGVARRAAQLFSFDKAAYDALNETGVNLEF
jgi:8-oxo-dGTP diphosphatase